jgi:ferric-dicitrate binding protein FerR (iron transport regulator)
MEIARPLEKALRVRPLSDEAVARMRSAVVREWSDVTVVSARRSRWRLAALAAGVAVLLVGAVVWLQPTTESPVAGVVARVNAPGLEARSHLFSRRWVTAGDVLRAGETVEAQGPALISLTGGGTLRIAGDSVVEVNAVNEVGMRRGQIYVDLPPELANAQAFSVRTSLGVVEHLGTQFEVATIADAVRIRVREGQIRLRGRSGSEIAGAGIELLASSSGTVARRPAVTYGRTWAWVDELAPDYVIENQGLADFLRWVARETGYRLEIADDHARRTVAETRLHGSIEGLTPLEALGQVLSTTSLRFDFPGDVIRVSSDH